MDRVVSLLPSLTETVCALGLRDRLVGRSHECDHPPEVLALPVLTSPKLDVTGGSREIDDRVRALVERGLSVYEVDAEKLRELRPDVVLTQDHCAVCAASLADVEEALRSFSGASPRVVSVAPRSLGEVFDAFRTVAAALGVPERGDALVQRASERLGEIGERTGHLAPRPRAACIEWIEPLMVAGNWVPELVRVAGGEPLLARAGEPSSAIDPAALIAADPDVVVLMPCGFDIPRTRGELPRLEGLPGWRELRAVRQGHVYVVDGNAYFNRPGPRLATSVEILAEVFHPERLDFGHAGLGYERA